MLTMFSKILHVTFWFSPFLFRMHISKSYLKLHAHLTHTSMITAVMDLFKIVVDKVHFLASNRLVDVVKK